MGVWRRVDGGRRDQIIDSRDEGGGAGEQGSGEGGEEEEGGEGMRTQIHNAFLYFFYQLFTPLLF